MKKIIALDIGGTNIKWALIDEKFEILEKGHVPTEAFEIKAAGVYKKAALIANELHEEHGDEIIGASISMPGVIDSKLGQPLAPITNLPSSLGVNIIEEFGRWTKLPAKVLNDANAAALGERAKGNLKDIENGVMITIGTGIGGGIIANGKLYQGFNYSSGEFGRHFIGEQRWEATSSTRTLISKASLMLGEKKLDGEKVVKLIDSEPMVRELFGDWKETIAMGISNIISMIAPEVVVIGGGISENPAFDIEMIGWRVNEILGLPFENKVKILKSKTGNDAALFGAALFFMEEHAND